MHAAAGDAGDATPPAASLTPVLLAVLTSCMGAIAFGYHLGVVNGPLEAIARDLGFLGNTGSQGLVVSSTLAGAALGSLTGGGLSDALGRKKSFLLAALPMVVGPLLCAYASSLDAMVAGRFVTGLAIGLSSALVPTYISEIAPTRVRGALGTVNQLSICLGILAALLVNVALPVAQWRAMFLIGAAPAVALGLGMLAAPESPRWLAANGFEASAEAAARKLWGPGGGLELGSSAAAKPTTPGGAAAAEASVGLSDLLFGRYARTMWIGILLFAFQQFAGINALVYFSTSVFKQAGVDNGTLASALLGATNVLGTIIAGTIIEKAGRKQLLTGSYMGQAAAMFAMAAAFTLPALRDLSAPIAVGGTVFYILSFALGAGPLTALVVPELNPARIRGRAVAAAFVSHWVCNVAVGQTFMAAVQQYGLATVYAFFGAVALGGALYVSAKVPETKGKTFEQIERELSA